jgi:hypothetical protein
VYAALLLALISACFSMDQNIVAMLNIKRGYKEQGWKFAGTTDELNLKLFCQDRSILYIDFVEVRVTSQLLHEYPLLFGVWAEG